MGKIKVLNLVADGGDFGAAPEHVQRFVAAVREYLEDGGSEAVAAAIARWAAEAAPRAYEGNLEVRLQDFVRRAAALRVDGGLVPAARAALSVVEDIRREANWPYLPSDVQREVYFWDVLAAIVRPELADHDVSYIERLAYWWATNHGRLGYMNGGVSYVFGDVVAEMSDAAVVWLATAEGAHSPFWHEAVIVRKLPIWEPEDSFVAARERHERFEADAALVPALREAEREVGPWPWLHIIARWWDALPPAERLDIETVRAIAARWCPSIWRETAYGDTYDATAEAVAEVIR